MFDKERLKEAKEALKIMQAAGQKKRICTTICNILREDIEKMRKAGISARAIVSALSKELGVEINEKTFLSFLYRNKKKNKSETSSEDYSKSKSESKSESKSVNLLDKLNKKYTGGDE